MVTSKPTTLKNRPEIKIYSRFNHPPKTPFTQEGEDSLVQEHFLEETNINYIIGRFAQTGILSSSDIKTARQPFVHSFAEGETYQQYLDKVMDAQRQFRELPSNIRNQFENDPEKLLKFVQDPKNVEEAVRLNILQKRVPEEPITVRLEKEPEKGSKPKPNSNKDD